jgi:hypothetical protein
MSPIALALSPLLRHYPISRSITLPRGSSSGFLLLLLLLPWKD